MRMQPGFTDQEQIWRQHDPVARFADDWDGRDKWNLGENSDLRVGPYQPGSRLQFRSDIGPCQSVTITSGSDREDVTVTYVADELPILC